jgi:hypothetical protein
MVRKVVLMHIACNAIELMRIHILFRPQSTLGRQIRDACKRGYASVAIDLLKSAKQEDLDDTELV